MNRIIAIFAVLALVGCTVVQDVDEFRRDETCDLDLTVSEFFPHANGATETQRDLRESFEFRIVREEEDSAGDLLRVPVATAVFEPLPAPRIHVRMPYAAEASGEGERAATLELLADRNTSRTADLPPEDHSWNLGNACGQLGIDYEHNTDFDQLTDPGPKFYGLIVRPRTFSANIGRALIQNPSIEVRVVRETIIDGVEVQQARAFLRRERSTGFDEPTVPTIDDLELELRNSMREESARVIVFLDFDGDGQFDGDGLDRVDLNEPASDFAVAVDIELSALVSCDASSDMDFCLEVRPLKDREGRLILDEEGEEIPVESIVVRPSFVEENAGTLEAVGNVPSLVAMPWWSEE